MKALIAVLPLLLIARAFALDAPAPPAALPPADGAHRYLIERTFPHGALDGLDAATKEKVNANNAAVGVRWQQSYANADKTKTFCIYEGPSENAVRKAAALNALPVDQVTEIPVTVDPGVQARAKTPAPELHRYLIEQSAASVAINRLDAAGKAKVNSINTRFGVRWVTSYATPDDTKTYCVYEGPSEAAVRNAVSASGMSVNRVTEIPLTLWPM